MRSSACALLAFASFASSSEAFAEGPFLVKPYLQIGADPSPSSLEVLWQTESASPNWKVELKTGSAKAFHPVDKGPTSRPVTLGKPHFVYRATLRDLKPGEAFEYRLLLDDKQVFDAQGHARSTAGDTSYKFAIFGDCGADTSGQKSIAYQTAQFKPDFVFIPGDIVYWHGLSSEYHNKFFPIYNSDEADQKSGAPLMRSMPFMATLGNHDVAGKDLGVHPEGLAYFYYWSLPLNGFADFTRPGFKGSADKIAAFKEASGDAFPRMSNYSFTYGNSFWLILDSSTDIDWAQPEHMQWVAQELASPAARHAKWRFIGFHHPPFSSSHMHAGDQQMRVLAKVFEDAKVDVVFSGHVHNYQRSMPMRFQLGSFDFSKNHQVTGEWTLDREFDGKEHQKPKGVIYIISGAGGALLYDKGQGAAKKSWKEFTTQFVSDVHSLTAVEVKGERASFQQIDEHGKVVDSFSISK